MSSRNLVDPELSADLDSAMVELTEQVLRWIESGGSGSAESDARRIVVMGESGGAAIAAGLALLPRDGGSSVISALVLLAPMLDDRTGEGVAATRPYGEFLWTPANNGFCWDGAMAGRPASADISPLRRARACRRSQGHACDLYSRRPARPVPPAITRFSEALVGCLHADRAVSLSRRLPRLHPRHRRERDPLLCAASGGLPRARLFALTRCAQAGPAPYLQFVI